MEFYNEHLDDDRFEIIAFHDARAKTFEELDEKCAGVKEKHWGGKDLPFPILLDSTGETIKQYDITAFPTLILFDPEGRLVGHAPLDTLKQALEGKVETPKPRARQVQSGG
ncbi:MAG: redoxin domain-containing protein [Phycisphaerales bacterium]|nr:redoxin domain-containing protein [Phycisphaerales bacterium]